MQAKLLALAASAPLMLVALVTMVGAVWIGGLLCRHLHFLVHFSEHNPYLDGLLRGIV